MDNRSTFLNNHLRNAVYLAIFLGMARKIVSKAYRPRKKIVRMSYSNGGCVFQVSPEFVTEFVMNAARNLERLESDELQDMIGDYEEVEYPEQEEIANPIRKALS